MDKKSKKIFIVGMHSSGKEEIVEDLCSCGIKVGKNFISVANPPTEAYVINSDTYDSQDIDRMFESSSYIFINKRNVGSQSFYEGLSLFEYDNNDVFVFTPDQYNMLPNSVKDAVVIWVDNSETERRVRYSSERRKYDFKKTERMQQLEIEHFANNLKSDVIYFANELPSRVSAVIYALVNYPKLLPIFTKRFN